LCVAVSVIMLISIENHEKDLMWKRIGGIVSFLIYTLFLIWKYEDIPTEEYLQTIFWHSGPASLVTIVLGYAIIGGFINDCIKNKKNYETIPFKDKLILELERNMSHRKIKKLLKITNDLDFQREEDGITPIIAAVRYTSATGFQDGETRTHILWKIIGRMNKEMVKAAINRQDKEGNTALMYSASQGVALDVALLLHFGANPKIENHKGETASSIASGSTWRFGVDLIEKGEQIEELLNIAKNYE